MASSVVRSMALCQISQAVWTSQSNIMQLQPESDLQKPAAQTAVTVSQGRVILTDVRSGFVDAAAPEMFIKLLQKRTGIYQLFGFRINPDPSQSIDPCQQIIPSFQLPSGKITVRGVQMSAKIQAALTATGTAGSFRLFRMSMRMQPLIQCFKHTSHLSGTEP